MLQSPGYGFSLFFCLVAMDNSSVMIYGGLFVSRWEDVLFEQRSVHTVNVLDNTLNRQHFFLTTSDLQFVTCTAPQLPHPRQQHLAVESPKWSTIGIVPVTQQAEAPEDRLTDRQTAGGGWSEPPFPRNPLGTLVWGNPAE